MVTEIIGLIPLVGSPHSTLPGRDPIQPDSPQYQRMNLTLRQKAQAILREASWDIAPPPVIWSPRLVRCAGLFVVEKDARGKWHPEIRLSIPLLRRRDWPWPQQVCGMNCHDPEQVQRRILEHELLHYKLWTEREKDWGHSERFRQLALEVFGHQSITHGIGSEPD